MDEDIRTEDEGKQEKIRNQEFSRDYVIACNCTYDINKEKLPYLVNDVTETPGDCENSANHRRAAVFEIDVEMKLESFRSFCLRSGQNEMYLCNSPKRSSSTSSYTSYSRESNEESGGEAFESKYSNLCIAKILHTKQRIRNLLRTPPGGATVMESLTHEITPIGIQTLKRSKSPRMSRIPQHYLTLGARTHSKKHNSNTLSSPNPNKNDVLRKNKPALVRSKSDINQSNKLTSYDLNADWLNVKSHSSEKKSANSNKKENILKRRTVLPFTRNELLKNVKDDDLNGYFQRRRLSMLDSLTDSEVSEALNDDSNKSNMTLKPLKTSSVKSNSPILDDVFLARGRSFSTIKKRFSSRLRSKSKEASRKSLPANNWLNIRYENPDNSFYFTPPASRRTLHAEAFPNHQYENYVPRKFDNNSLPTISRLTSSAESDQLDEKSRKRKSMKKRISSFVAKRSPTLRKGSTFPKHSPSSSKHQPKNISLSSHLSSSFV